MKSYIFSFIMILVALQTAMAQQGQQPSECSITDGCLNFSLNGAKQHDEDTYILSYTVTVNCSSPLEYVAFQLPEGSEADEPSSYFASQPDFNVEDGKKGKDGKIVTAYNAIQFTAKQKTNISNGASYTFEYPISVKDYNALSSIKVQARVAGAAASNVEFNHRVCAPLASAPSQRPMPDCRVDLGQAVFGFMGATNNGDGTTSLGFMIQNNLQANAETITIEIPGAPEGVTVESNNNGASYSANYKYKATYQDGILTFAAQNTNGYAAGATDYFLFSVPTATFNPEENFTLTLAAGSELIVTGFNTITCSEDGDITPLPVELLSFKGKATQSGIDLEWETASEKDNDRFEVERSQDGKTFSKIGEVAGAGTTSIKQNYDYTDYVSNTGTFHYRLRQIDFDGTTSYSKIVSVRLKALPGGGKLAVYPNPALGSIVTVSVAGTGADVNGGILQIVDMSGRQMYVHQVAAGTRQLKVQLQELGLPKGMYVVNLVQGTDKQTQKLIIQ
ncbi:T9SS type A sorting domain-containing protein [Pontibacter fetidus]|uniref:T9SS type A sorting domain-containing protein n=1 Tax=Pontibacter fetidus TaxID=2700082 RepID=A0A6B2H562_9BACT|nr:T9SS type A sorting domain-containing protein [Pontibacter fetidus]NDK57611.1 T9SS type A sorting domain-containing protein [Pontibacter fetidus]